MEFKRLTINSKDNRQINVVIYKIENINKNFEKEINWKIVIEFNNNKIEFLLSTINFLKFSNFLSPFKNKQ